ncbi:MAG: T9SS C-terminal target domain-containing protein [Bacteroidetes bacterium]|nr:MAG: T9SS C-terminal target domain-containing protein [Bacteroidota bacterium]
MQQTKTLLAYAMGLLGLISLPFGGHAQILNIDPVFPTVNDTVTIVYDATQGNGALVGVTPVYAHTGLITSNSTAPNDWKYVQGNWGTADPKVLMTDLGNNLHQIQYHIQSYYSVPGTEDVESLAFVFRSQDGSVVGRDADGSDIFYPIYDPNDPLQILVLTPGDGLIRESGDEIIFRGAASNSGTLTLFLNGNQIKQTTGKELRDTLTAGTPGGYWLSFRADDGTDVVEDSIYFVVRGQVQTEAVPGGTEPGINYLGGDTSVVLSLYAPNKSFVYVLGDFNDWTASPEYFMKRSLDNATWWLEVGGLTPGEEYAFQYLVDGEIYIADPYADKVLDPWNDPWISSATYPGLKPYPDGAAGIVSVLQTGQTPYPWQHPQYDRPANDELLVYELHLRDFIGTHDYRTLIDTLDYLERLGVNAIELMPIMEFEGNNSWGYNPSFFFAPDKYYGPKDDLKAFIDTCHARGMVVILDMVLNHAFGQNSLVRLYWDGVNNRPAADNPWFNPEATHPFSVGYDFNHESPQTQEFADRVLAYWIEEYKFDGYRMDLSKGFTQTNSGGDVGQWSNYDASRIALLKRMYDQLRTVDSTAYFILEHFGNNTEEKELAEYGMMLWGNHNFNYNEATMGYHDSNKSNFGGIAAQNRGWNVPHLVGYMESHDEERLMVKNLRFGNSAWNYDVTTLNTALARMEMAGAFFFPIPGPKMIWQFGEVGYDISIQRCPDGSEDYGCRVDPKPIRWNYYQNNYNRQRLYNVWSALMHLRRSHPVFRTDDFELSVAGAFKRITLRHDSMSVVIVGNFDVTHQTASVPFPANGTWYDYFSQETINVSGSYSFALGAGEWHVYTDQPLVDPDVTLSADDVFDVAGLVAYPNPFRDNMSLRYDLAKPAAVTATVMDLTGRVVTTLAHSEQQGAGTHWLSWDGQTASGRAAPAGVYLLRLEAGAQSHTLRIMRQ